MIWAIFPRPNSPDSATGSRPVLRVAVTRRDSRGPGWGRHTGIPKRTPLAHDWLNGALSGTIGLVAPRIKPLRSPAIGFAHRGARAHARENTIEAFKLALTMGATGLESDVWITRDGIPVLDHDGVIGSVLRRRSINSVDRADLPAHIPTMRQFYALCGTDFEFSLDIKDVAAADATMAAVHQTEADLGIDIAGRTWLCHPDFETVAAWREKWTRVKLVHSTRLHHLKDGPERHASRLSEAGIDCLNMRQPDWTGGLATLVHRFDVHCFAWDLQLNRLLAEVLDMGVDGIYSDHTDRMMAAISACYRT